MTILHALTPYLHRAHELSLAACELGTFMPEHFLIQVATGWTFTGLAVLPAWLMRRKNPVQ